jgi:hypothetical protein
VVVNCDKSVLRVFVSWVKSLLIVLVRLVVLESLLPELLPVPQFSEPEPLLVDVVESPLLELEPELEPQLSEPLPVVPDVAASLLPDVLDVPESPFWPLLEEDESEQPWWLPDESELLLPVDDSELLLLEDDSELLLFEDDSELLLPLFDVSQPLLLWLPHSLLADVPPPPAVVDSEPLPRLLLPPVPFSSVCTDWFSELID